MMSDSKKGVRGVPRVLWLVTKWVVFPVVGFLLVLSLLAYGAFYLYVIPMVIPMAEEAHEAGWFPRFANPFDPSYDSELTRMLKEKDHERLIPALERKVEDGTADTGVYSYLAVLHGIDERFSDTQRMANANRVIEIGLQRFPDAKFLIQAAPPDFTETGLKRLESLRGRSVIPEQELERQIVATKRIIAIDRAREISRETRALRRQNSQVVQARYKRMRELEEEQKAFARGTPRHAAIQSEIDRVRKEFHEAVARGRQLAKDPRLLEARAEMDRLDKELDKERREAAAEERRKVTFP